MITKIYKLIGMDACLMKTVYCGVKVNMEFRSGNHLNGKHAVLITRNPFVQDAIENDERFGSVFNLAAAYGESESKDTAAATEEPKSSREAKKMKVSKQKAEKEKAEKEAVNGYKDVPEVKDVNDAIEYFTVLGEMVENEEQIKEMADKHRVRFTNFVM